MEGSFGGGASRVFFALPNTGIAVNWDVVPIPFLIMEKHILKTH